MWMTMTREEKIKELLSPITWELDLPLKYRQNLVYSRRDEVRNAYPLLTKAHKKLADKWLESEQHSYLWD